MPARRIAIAADDYGISPGVDGAILELIRKERLSAVSCMTVFDRWGLASQELRHHGETIDLGLHFTLTKYPPLSGVNALGEKKSHPGPSSLFLASLVGIIDATAITNELNAQIDRFIDGTGRPPDYVDGHHHVHQFPVICDAVTACVDERLPTSWIRQCGNTAANILGINKTRIKTGFLAFGSLKLQTLCRRNGIKMNAGFSGCYDFSSSPPYDVLFERFVHYLPDLGLVMCHPGKVDATLAQLDDLTEQREVEFEFLKSRAFTSALDRADVKLVRLSEQL